MKFSIVVPCFNEENNIISCLNSIITQSYQNFEIIVVNDGSTDNSLKLIKSIKNERIIIINKDNEGLSIARNIGVKKCTGDYILFVDGDDYIEKDLLKKLNDTITDEDIIRFQVRKIDSNESVDYYEDSFFKLNGAEAFRFITRYKYVELSTLYAYRKDYFINNNYEFTKNTYHEDFGLIPLVIIKANTVSSISYIGYNYVNNENSIMNNKKEYAKAKDALTHYQNIINKYDDKYYKSFLANSVILKLKYLDEDDKKEYLEKLKELKVFDNILSDTFERKTKKFLYKHFIDIALKVVK